MCATLSTIELQGMDALMKLRELVGAQPTTVVRGWFSGSVSPRKTGKLIRPPLLPFTSTNVTQADGPVSVYDLVVCSKIFG